MRLAILVTAIVAASSTSPSPADALTSCVWVRAENDGSGSGFVVDVERRWVVTCRHVVADRDRVDVFFPWFRDGELVTDKREYLGNRLPLRDRGLLVTGKVLKRHDAADLALVELASLPRGARAIPLASKPAWPGDVHQVVGHRLDLDTLWNVTVGPVRQTGRLANGYTWRGRKLATNADALLGQWPIEEGDSGGPVVNVRGDLVGMVSALRRQAPSAAIAISTAEIRAFLSLPPSTARADRAGIADTLTRATVWVRPTATDFHAAGVLIDRNHILTSARGIGSSERVGVAFPLQGEGGWVGERELYRDPVGLHLRGAWRAGTVLARDSARDLALIRVESIPAYCRPVPLASGPLRRGDRVHTMNHPGGLEFAWAYAAGSVRQCGRVALADGGSPIRVMANVYQIPTQAGSPGGPVLNARGELVGVMSARESSQQTGYSTTSDEVARFLDTSWTDRPVKTLDGWIGRSRAMPERLAEVFAAALAARAKADRAAGQSGLARRGIQVALTIDPRCSAARAELARITLADIDKHGGSGQALDEVRHELDGAVEQGRFDRDAIFLRAKLAARGRQDWRQARGDLERILDVLPDDAEVRQCLVGVLLELSKDDEAAAAVRDTLRAAPSRLPILAADLLAQADKIAKKFPDSPSPAAGWLRRALSSALKAGLDPVTKGRLEEALTKADRARDDAERLAILRGLMRQLAATKY